MTIVILKLALKTLVDFSLTGLNGSVFEFWDANKSLHS
jgi:hypothetical protein